MCMFGTSETKLTGDIARNSFIPSAILDISSSPTNPDPFNVVWLKTSNSLFLQDLLQSLSTPYPLVSPHSVYPDTPHQKELQHDSVEEIKGYCIMEFSIHRSRQRNGNFSESIQFWRRFDYATLANLLILNDFKKYHSSLNSVGDAKSLQYKHTNDGRKSTAFGSNATTPAG